MNKSILVSTDSGELYRHILGQKNEEKIYSNNENIGISCIKYTKDLNYLILGEVSGKMKIFDQRKNQTIKSLSFHQGEISNILDFERCQNLFGLTSTFAHSEKEQPLLRKTSKKEDELEIFERNLNTIQSKENDNIIDKLEFNLLNHYLNENNKPNETELDFWKRGFKDLYDHFN